MKLQFAALFAFTVAACGGTMSEDDPRSESGSTFGDETPAALADETPAIYAGEEAEPYPCDEDADCQRGWTCQFHAAYDQQQCLPNEASTTHPADVATATDEETCIPEIMVTTDSFQGPDLQPGQPTSVLSVTFAHASPACDRPVTVFDMTFEIISGDPVIWCHGPCYDIYDIPPEEGWNFSGIEMKDVTNGERSPISMIGFVQISTINELRPAFDRVVELLPGEARTMELVLTVADTEQAREDLGDAWYQVELNKASATLSTGERVALLGMPTNHYTFTILDAQ